MSLLELFILILFYAAGLAIAIIPSIADIRKSRGRGHPKKLTRLGKWFVVSCFVLFAISIYKDYNTSQLNSAAEKARHNYESSLTHILHQSDSIENIHANMFIDTMKVINHSLVRSDTLHSHHMTGFMDRLDDWGLEIRDSNIVRKEAGNPLIVLANYSLDSTLNTYTLKFDICNMGSSEAFDATIDIFQLQSIHSINNSSLLISETRNFGAKSCWNRKLLFDKSIPFYKIVIFVEGKYQDRKGNDKKYNYTLYYDKDFKEWGLK